MHTRTYYPLLVLVLCLIGSSLRLRTSSGTLKTAPTTASLSGASCLHPCG